jgi:hypothetical protein
MYSQMNSCFAPYGGYFGSARKLMTVHLLNATKVRVGAEVRGVMGAWASWRGGVGGLLGELRARRRI